MAQTHKEYADQLFESKYNLIRPIITNYNWHTVKKTIIELCLDEVNDILNIDLIDDDEDNSKFYREVRSYLDQM